MEQWGIELVATNPAARVTVERVGNGGHRVVILDDFYLHAERLLELVRELDYAGDREVTGDLPGGRASVPLDAGELVLHMSGAWGAELVPFVDDPPLMFSSIRNGDRSLDHRQRQPHVDPGITALVYLNPDEECTGGTGLYRHRPTGIERIPRVPTRALLSIAAERGYDARSFREPGGYRRFLDEVFFAEESAVPRNEFVNDGNDHWELLHLVAMRFNRLVLFDGAMPHSQHLDPGAFRDRPRLNQIFFLRESV